MSLKFISTPQCLTIYLSGEIDHHNAVALRIESDCEIQKELSPNIRLDFDGVTFMDSSGIGFVMGRYRLANSYGAKLEVVNLSRRLFDMMKLAGLEKFIILKTKKERK